MKVKTREEMKTTMTTNGTTDVEVIFVDLELCSTVTLISNLSITIL